MGIREFQGDLGASLRVTESFQRRFRGDLSNVSESSRGFEGYPEMFQNVSGASLKVPGGF